MKKEWSKGSILQSRRIDLPSLRSSIAGQCIRQRVKLTWTQADLAKAAKTSQTAISRFEAGRGNPTVEFLYRIAQALGIELVVHFS